MRPDRPPIRSVELFAGAGGAALGLREAGIEALACVEWDPNACAILRAAGFPAVEADVRAVDWSPWAGNVDLLWASPPCQAFSLAGKRLGAADERNGWPWTWEAIDALRAAGIGPKAVLCENVKGILSHAAAAKCGKGREPKPEACPGCYWTSAILVEARRRFAHVEWRLLDAADFGVPQRRMRVILAAWNPHDASSAPPAYEATTGAATAASIRHAPVQPSPISHAVLAEGALAAPRASAIAVGASPSDSTILDNGGRQTQTGVADG